MSDNPQVVGSVVVDSAGTVIAYDAHPDNLADDEFWSCTYRAIIKAACAIRARARSQSRHEPRNHLNRKGTENTRLSKEALATTRMELELG